MVAAIHYWQKTKVGKKRNVDVRNLFLPVNAMTHVQHFNGGTMTAANESEARTKEKSHHLFIQRY